MYDTCIIELQELDSEWYLAVLPVAFYTQVEAS